MRLEEYARGNTLIYSTHLPFMIDLRHPERIRVINDSAEGAVVTEAVFSYPGLGRLVVTSIQNRDYPVVQGALMLVVVIFLLLTAYFQSFRLALASVAALPAALAGVALMLLVTGTTLNLQSFMGTIMAMGVAVAKVVTRAP